ncbi:MAG: transglutaminase-like putative cysteine protease [Crocinitomicaceae bacterium]
MIFVRTDTFYSVPKKASHNLIPPILLTSLALLFWGVTSDNVLIALLLAVILDCRRWIPLKWDFDENAQVKAFQFSLLLVTAGVAISWIDDTGPTGALNVMTWMPIMFFPVEFVQRYGQRDTVALNSFFFFSRRRMALDRKEGREVRTTRINTGYPYVFGAILAASTTEALEWYFWGGLCVLVFAVVLSVSHTRGMRSRSLWLVMPVVVALGWGIQWTMTTAYLWVKEHMQGLYSQSGGNTLLADYMSQLSELGNIELNPRIEWRVWSESNPEYLRLAGHNNYMHGRWTYDYTAEEYDGLDQSYQEPFSSDVVMSDSSVTYFRRSDKKLIELSKKDDFLEIRGTVIHRQPSSVVPTAPGFYGVTDILGDEVYAKVNSMGALRFTNRDMVISYSVYADANKSALDKPPLGEVDLRIPNEEKQVISELADRLGLRSIDDPREVIAIIKQYFRSEFEYSTQFDPGVIDYDRSLIEWFLNDVKRGHCEYYATAAVLLLREVGIPSRYAMGYAVSERGSDCWNVRGTNAHAWTRAYIDGNWINVDLTPADLRGVTSQGGMSSVDWLRERINLIREDFFIWKQDAANRSGLLVKVTIVAALLLLWILYRLWKHRTRREAPKWSFTRWTGDPVVTPLHRLERTVQKKVGPRAEGEPYSVWVKKLASCDGVDQRLVSTVIQSHQEMRYDPTAEVDQKVLRELVKELKRQTRKG